MHLISALCGGFAGAENGTADIYLRQTSTRATVYDTFEGAGARTPTAGIPLDAHGGVTIYVYGLVDITVRDADGQIVRQFTDGYSAPNIEVISDSFTGTDYDDGSSATSEPTNLATVLDGWLTSAGQPDFDVDVSGTKTTLKSAISNLGGVFFNVKSSIYGAIGDNTADDTSAIAEALVAAQVAGGTVYFPPGTYMISSALAVGSKVSLMGAGAAASIITINHASNNLLTYGSASSDIQMITGLSLQAKQANTGDMIRTADNVHLRIDSCHIGNANMQGHCLECITTDGGVVTAVKSTFEAGTSTKHVLTTVGRLDAFGCRFVFAAAAFNTICWDGVKGGSAFGCYIEANAVTSGTFTGIKFANTTAKHCVISGCYFPAPTGGTFTAWQDATTTGFMESLNTYGASVAVLGPTDPATFVTGFSSFYGSRMSRHYAVTNTGGNITVDPYTYGFISIKRTTTNADHTVDLGNNMPPIGTAVAIQYYNNSGGNIANLTFAANAANVKGLAAFTLNNGIQKLLWLVVGVDPVSGGPAWMAPGVNNT